MHRYGEGGGSGGSENSHAQQAARLDRVGPAWKIEAMCPAKRLGGHSVHRRPALALALSGMVVQHSLWRKFLTLPYPTHARAVTSAPEEMADVIARRTNNLN